jgi:protein SCO1/2
MALLNPRRAQGLVALAFALVVATTGYWYFFGRPSPEPAGCIVNPPARIGGPLALTVAGAGEPADFSGRPTLLYFGFTHCPDICPTTMYLAADALKALGRPGENIQTALVSVDPERDTADVLAAYVQTEGFPKGLVGLTGSRQDIDAAAKAFAVNYRRVPTGDDYTISHTSFLYVMDANWRVRSMISTIGRTPDDVAGCIREGLGRDLR